MGVKRWTKIGKPEVLAQGFGKRFVRQSFKDHRARNVDFFMFFQKDFSIVLPVTDDGNVILVRQFKQGSGRFTEELPAGGFSSEGESPRIAARRELLEETGYRAKKLVYLGFDWIDSRSCPNRFYCFLATGCHRVAGMTLDDQEDIQVVERPLWPWLREVISGKGTGGWGTSSTVVRALPHLGVTVKHPKKIPGAA